MLYRMDKLIGMSISASDGELGKVKDIYFDDHRWAVRYLVVDTGGWLANRKVLISPFGVEKIDWDLRSIHVILNKKQVKDSPNFNTDKPVSRQHEVEFLGYYNYPGYWGGPFLWGAMPCPILPVLSMPVVNEARPDRVETQADSHLRSAGEVTGYNLQATDHSIGHLQDFLVDEKNWAIRYVVVDTHNWWPGKHVVIPAQWIKQLDWSENVVKVDVSRDVVQSAPEFDPHLEFSRVYETDLHRHYRRPGYWQ